MRCAVNDMRRDRVQAAESSHVPQSLQSHYTEDAVFRCIPSVTDTWCLLCVTGKDFVKGDKIIELYVKI